MYAPQQLSPVHMVVFAVTFVIASSVVGFNVYNYWNTSYMYLMLLLNSVNLIPPVCFFLLLPGTNLDSHLSRNNILTWSRSEKIRGFLFLLIAGIEIVCAVLLNLTRLQEV